MIETRLNEAEVERPGCDETRVLRPDHGPPLQSEIGLTEERLETMIVFAKQSQSGCSEKTTPFHASRAASEAAHTCFVCAKAYRSGTFFFAEEKHCFRRRRMPSRSPKHSVLFSDVVGAEENVSVRKLRMGFQCSEPN